MIWYAYNDVVNEEKIKKGGNSMYYDNAFQNAFREYICQEVAKDLASKHLEFKLVSKEIT